MKKIVLASASPRRKEILSNYNVDIDIIKSNIEEIISEKENPEVIAMSLAFQKALDVSKKVETGMIVLAADTIVYMNEIFGKPKDEVEAFNMLKKLSGKTHFVITGFSIIKSGTNIKIIDYCKTKVKFRDLSEEQIIKYIKTGEYKDKAGAYGIQGYGGILVDYIEGSYFSVVGLPISKIDYLFDKYFNISLL